MPTQPQRPIPVSVAWSVLRAANAVVRREYGTPESSTMFRTSPRDAATRGISGSRKSKPWKFLLHQGASCLYFPSSPTSGRSYRSIARDDSPKLEVAVAHETLALH